MSVLFPSNKKNVNSVFPLRNWIQLFHVPRLSKPVSSFSLSSLYVNAFISSFTNTSLDSRHSLMLGKQPFFLPPISQLLCWSIVRDREKMTGPWMLVLNRVHHSQLINLAIIKFVVKDTEKKKEKKNWQMGLILITSSIVQMLNFACIFGSRLSYQPLILAHD